MHLVPKPDRFERALAHTPGLRIFTTYVSFLYCLDSGRWLLGGIFFALVVVSLLDEYLPRIRKPKPEAE